MNTNQHGTPVVLIGKGISARRIETSDEYEVACISESVRLADQCDYLGINDVPALCSMWESDFKRTKTVVLPTHLHVDTRGHETVEWIQVVHWLGSCTDVETYRLPSCPDLERYGSTIGFGTCWSTAESLVAFLLSKGYRRFITTGIEDGNDRYHPMFKPRAVKNKHHFRKNYQRIKQRIDDAGATMERWETCDFCK